MWVFFVSLGVTLDSAKTPFVETPLFLVPVSGKKKVYTTVETLLCLFFWV